MMTISRILVDVDAHEEEHAALDSAVDLASRSGARITITDVLPLVPTSARRFVTAAVEQELIDSRWQRLRALAGSRKADAVLLRGSPAVALVREVLRGQHDLLVRSHGRRAAALPMPFGAIDMQLLRTCPSPVWLVGAGSARRPQRLLAAIDTTDIDDSARDLNRRIVEMAALVRDLEGGTLTLLQAWTPFGLELLRSRMSERELEAFAASARAAVEAQLEAFVRTLDPAIGRPAALLIEGEPHRVIPECARREGIDLVVMGTVARTGLAGWVMGNTAERVLRELRGSVLALKPASFVSPVSA